LDDLPDGSQLSQIPELEDDIINIDSHTSDNDSQTEKLVLISNRLPPILVRLLRWVEEGLFVEMAELSPSYLDSADCTTDDQQTGPHKTPILWDIMDWVQCFGEYTAIVSCQKPKHVPDLLGYQNHHGNITALP